MTKLNVKFEKEVEPKAVEPAVTSVAETPAAVYLPQNLKSNHFGHVF